MGPLALDKWCGGLCRCGNSVLRNTLHAFVWVEKLDEWKEVMVETLETGREMWVCALEILGSNWMGGGARMREAMILSNHQGKECHGFGIARERN